MCPQSLPSAYSPSSPLAPLLGTKFTQCKYAEPHARTHEDTRTHTHTHSRRTNAHRHSHWQLSFPFSISLSPSPSAAYCITTHFFRFCCSYKTLISAISLLAKRGRHVDWAWQAGDQALRAPRNCLKIVCKCCTR